MERKQGCFYSWNERGYGLIFITPQERYFMHISEFFADHLPIVGERVSFLIGPPRKAGALPCAIDVRPIAAVQS